MKSSPLLDTIAQYHMIPQKSTVFLGVSGGADSIYLLHRLHQLQDTLDFTLIVLHLNHQLRGVESQRDEDFVRDFVAEFCPSVPLIVEHAPVATLAAAQKVGVEEMARICRYEFFHKHAHTVEHSRIATAHNANDNSETVVMNLTRGAGLLGLSGIPPVRGAIIRPLLTTTRQEILDYLALHSLPHVEDSTNGDSRYTRNRIRHEVMGVLTEQNPSLHANLSALTPILREEDEILNQLAESLLPPVTQHPHGISLSAIQLATLPTPLALRGIQMLVQRVDDTLILELGHRSNILTLCKGAHPSASLNLPHGLTAHRQYHQLVFTTRVEVPLVTTTHTLPFEVDVAGHHISAIQGVYDGEGNCNDFWIAGRYTALTLRPRQEGDRLHRPNRQDKTVKSLMIDEKIPRHQRDNLPVLSAEDKVVAAVGLGVNQQALPQLGEMGWHITITTTGKDEQHYV